MERTTSALLSLGSNLGDRRANLSQAVRQLRALGELTAVSALYETEPMEVTDQPWFLNCAVELVTPLSADELLRAALSIESSMGRQRVVVKGPRSIDIDIIFFGDSVIDTPALTVPHPALAERRFVLVPLAEIAPEFIHPTLHRNVRELLQSLPQGAGEARIYSPAGWFQAF